MTPVSTALGRRNERLHKRPFLVRHIARIAQSASVIASAIFCSSTSATPPNESGRLLELQMIPPIQFVLGRALRRMDIKGVKATLPTPGKLIGCWQHKTLNVLDKLPKSVQPNAHRDLREIWLSENRAVADATMTTFAEKYAPKYDKAVDCLLKDRDALLTFFDFPAEHWTHLRTSNPIESAFATVRHRTVRMKGALSQDTARLMVFKLIMAAARNWRRLQGQNQLPKIVQGVNIPRRNRSREPRNVRRLIHAVTQIPA